MKKGKNLNVWLAMSIFLLMMAGAAGVMSSAALAEEQIYEADVCVYSGTASGVTAAVSAAKRGHSVIVVEPSRWLGGMVGGGIQILEDCAYPNDIGGLTKMMMQKDNEIGGGRNENQPKFRELFVQLVKEHNIQVIYAHRLGTVKKEAKRITELSLDYAPPANDGCPAPTATKKDAIRVKSKVFIDASYEGDLMAKAGVSYVIGRESRDTYNESLAGQRSLRVFDISPYIDPEDPASGLLPMIDKEPFNEGAASRHIIAYNFRLQWLENSAGSPIGAPSHYDTAQYALVRRALDVNRRLISWPQSNYARTKMISGGIPGRQSDYPDADWPERSAIWQEWIEHVKTMHALTGSKKELRSGEYPESDDFPNQLYIRLARRMVGSYVTTQHDLMHQTEINDSIGLGFYAVDIYPTRLIAHEGKVASEGSTFVRVSPGPYQISYRSLIPKKSECENLLVPVCISASHVALASIRMEPTYMVMGESAGIAASHAIDENKAVQDIDITEYQQDLRKSGVILEWNGKGYGPKGRYYWRGKPWWKITPEDYKKRPIRLDPIWGNDKSQAAKVEAERNRETPASDLEMAIIKCLNKENRIANIQKNLVKPAKGVDGGDDVSGEWVCFTTMSQHGRPGNGVMYIQLEQNGNQLKGTLQQLKGPDKRPPKPINKDSVDATLVGELIKDEIHNMMILHRQNTRNSFKAIFSATINGDGRTAIGQLVNRGGNYGTMLMVKRDALMDYKHLLTDADQQPIEVKAPKGINELEGVLNYRHFLLKQRNFSLILSVA